VKLGRLSLAIESSSAEFDRAFGTLYGVVGGYASDSVPDVVFQLRPEGRSLYRWFVDGEPVEDSCSPALALAHFEWAMHEALAVALLPAVTVHAAVAAHPTGPGLAMVGISGSGKSTLVAGLVASGWTLFADEFFVIEPAGNYVPMPGVITLKGAAIDLIRNRSRNITFSETAEDPFRGLLAHLATSRVASLDFDLQLKAVVFPRFQAGAPVSLTRLDSSSAFFRIAEQSHNYHLLGSRAFHNLATLARVPSFALDFGDLDSGLDALRSVMPS
jgi:HprK-related kinase A